MSFAEFFRNRHHVAQTVFILIILYTVSSINVLILALDIVPRLPGAYIDTSVLIAFGAVSLVSTLVVGIYHLYTMIYRKKRRTDVADDPGAQQEGGAGNWFFGSSGGAKFVFVLLVLYAVAAAVVLLLTFGVISDGYRYNQFLLMGLSLMSFAVAAVISVFHLGTLIMRRKRSTDKIRNGES